MIPKPPARENCGLSPRRFDNIDVPFIVVKSNDQDLARRELEIGVVVGRAPDSDIVIRDILLSRRHCRFIPSDDGWKIQDLQSKNGTFINGERLRVPRLLNDNDVIRLGRSKIIFHAGVLDDDFAEELMSPARPADPGDSLAGTLSGFSLLLPGETEAPGDMPCPRPRPKDPPAYDHEELQTLLTAIASSSWDSVYAEARQPLRSAELVGDSQFAEEDSQPRRRVRPSSPTDFSLQVEPPVAVATAPPPKPAKKPRPMPPLHLMVSVVWVGFLALLMTNHKPTAGGATPQFAVPMDAAETAPVQLDPAAAKTAGAQALSAALRAYLALP
jgi:hypothetical protein